MQLYIVTPLFVLAYVKSKTFGNIITSGAIILCLALRYFFYDKRDNANRFFHFRIASYLVGVLFSQMGDFFSNRKYLAKPLMCLIPCLILVNHIYFYEALERGRDKLYYVYMYPIAEATFISLISCLFIMASLLDDPNSRINSFMKNRFFTFWSAISYEHLFLHAFLCEFIRGHWPWLWSDLPHTLAGLMTACLVLTILPAPLSYLAEKYISKPIEKWGLEITGVIALSGQKNRVINTPGDKSSKTV
jgi:peptidoglycan/LPS O-acetylase OafA/YrhL